MSRVEELQAELAELRGQQRVLSDELFTELLAAKAPPPTCGEEYPGVGCCHEPSGHFPETPHRAGTFPTGPQATWRS